MSLQVPDLRNKVAVVTGANSGIGNNVVRALVKNNCEVVLAVRDVGKGERAAKLLQRDIPHARVHVKEVNLESMASVKQLSKEVKSLNKPVNILVNGAGRFVDDAFSVTNDGFEQVCLALYNTLYTLS